MIAAPNIAARDIPLGLDVAAALYRLGDALIAACEHLDAHCGPDIEGAIYDLSRDAHDAAEAALRHCLLDLGCQGDGQLPPIRGAEGRRLYIQYWSILQLLGWPDVRWIGDQDSDLQAAVRAQTAQIMGQPQERRERIGR